VQGLQALPLKAKLGLELELELEPEQQHLEVVRQQKEQPWPKTTSCCSS
jgi:hypothetical protein